MSIPVVITYNGNLANSGGDTDLLELTPADDYPIRLRRFILSQSSELGDAAEESLRITVRRLGSAVTSGSGGGSPTKETPDSNGGTVQLAAEANNTTVATTSGANDVLLDTNWNIRSSPCEFAWPDERFAPTARGAEALVIRCESTVTDDLSFSITAEVEEG